jgi:hypothetical protein
MVKSAMIADSVDLAEMLGATMAVMWVEKYEKGRRFHVSQWAVKKLISTEKLFVQLSADIYEHMYVHPPFSTILRLTTLQVFCSYPTKAFILRKKAVF